MSDKDNLSGIISPLVSKSGSKTVLTYLTDISAHHAFLTPEQTRDLIRLLKATLSDEEDQG